MVKMYDGNKTHYNLSPHIDWIWRVCHDYLRRFLVRYLVRPLVVYCFHETLHFICLKGLWIYLSISGSEMFHCFSLFLSYVLPMCTLLTYVSSTLLLRRLISCCLGYILILSSFPCVLATLQACTIIQSNFCRVSLTL